MGQKVNPVGLRLGVNRGWDSVWYAKKKDFGKFLIEDFKIREYIKKNVINSGVSKVMIERTSKKCFVTIYTSRPGFVIGKKGSDIEKIKNKITDFFIVFGRVPLFYYFLHILVIHIFAIIVLIVNGGDPNIMFNMTPFLGHQQQLVEYGYPMWVVYFVWFVVILMLYPLCYKYMNYKSNSNKWWLSYL